MANDDGAEKVIVEGGSIWTGFRWVDDQQIADALVARDALVAELRTAQQEQWYKNDAELASTNESLRQQLAETRADADDNREDSRKVRGALAEAQATIEKVRDWNADRRGPRDNLDDILDVRHVSVDAPELFPGTREALDGLTIRKDGE